MAIDSAKVRSIFIQAIECHSPEERHRYLEIACGGDLELRHRAEALLRAHEGEDAILDQGLLKAEIVEGNRNHPSVTESPGTLIGPYKLLEQFGEGGFGVVFMAEQQQPVHRKVALKVIKPGMDSKQVIARFEAERQALALMEHPHIARVLDAGATDAGRPYFVMELVRGIPITEFGDQNRLTPKERLELFVTVCQAVQHAHQKGIIHRDLKPPNVLVTLQDDGTPLVKVIDVGIAKALGHERLTEKTLCTGFAQMLGTPLYMSPEQAQMGGQEADTRSDIYALGVLLYELLTGTTPFDRQRLKEASYDEIRRIIREEEPAKPSTRISTLGQAASTVSANRKSEPRRLSQLFRGELDWIVMKALEKDRNRRYETASAFAADVQRYLHDEAVQACPPSAGYRFRKFARRNKGALATAATVACALLLALVGLAASNILLTREKAQTEAAKEELERSLYLQRIALAEREWSANNLSRVEQLLEACPPNLRGWEWRYLKRLRYQTVSPLRHDSAVDCVAFNPASPNLVSGSRDGTITLWDVHTGRPARTFRDGKNMILSVAFSPDGKRCVAACSDGKLKIWDIQAGKIILAWKPDNVVGYVVFSPDGRRLASASLDDGWEGKLPVAEIKIWDAGTGQEILTFDRPNVDRQTSAVQCLAFSPGGLRLALAEWDGTVKVWDAVAGRELFPCHGRHTATVFAVAFSSDGQTLASASGDWSKLGHGEVKLWDARTGQERLTLRGHIGLILTVAFSPDGRRLASAGMDRTIKLWDVATGEETLTLRGHELVIQAVAFSQDGRQLASASGDHTVRIWDATPLEERQGEEPLTLGVHPAGVLSIAFHPDGRLATAADDAVKLWDSHTGRELLSFPDSRGFAFGQGCWSIAFSPDGRRLAGGAGGEVKVWDVSTGHTLHRLSGFGNVASRVAFRPDSQQLVSAHLDKTLRVWDTTAGRELYQIPAHDFSIMGMALSPDGKTVITASADETVKVWDLGTRRHIRTLEPRHPLVPKSVAFRPDGRLLASASADGTIKLWDTGTWKQQGENLRDPAGGVENLAFSPDGQLLAWGSTDATVKVWDARTNKIQSLHGHTSWVEGVAFSPDGKRLASASLDGTVKIWNVPPLAESTGIAKH